MKHSINEVSLDQLADLARNGGISIQQELPDKVQGMMAGRRASDKARQSSGSDTIKRILTALKF